MTLRLTRPQIVIGRTHSHGRNPRRLGVIALRLIMARDRVGHEGEYWGQAGTEFVEGDHLPEG